MKAIVVPQFGETSRDEMALIRWTKHIGDTVTVGEVVCEVETDKAVLGIEAVDEGKLARIETPEGATVRPGDIIGYLEA